VAVKLPFPDNFAPEPTVFKGGIKRMIDIWNTLRDKNPGGYGGGAVLQAIGGRKNAWGVPVGNVTSCSPFTATVLGMLFDPSGASSGETFEPVYDGGTKPLPVDFYSMHQSNYWNRKGYHDAFQSRGWDYANDPAGSVEFFNLGYEVEGKDLRRGDVVGINWSNGGGHAVFVWDVHLDERGEVDAFCYLSSNGLKKLDGTFAGNGVSIGGCGGKKYLSGSRGSLATVASPLFQDRPDHIVDAEWLMLPNKSKKLITQAANFKAPGPPKNALDYTDYPKKPANAPPKWEPPKWPFHVRSFKAARLWGIHPPDRAPSTARQGTAWQLAKHLGYENAPESYATGTGKAVAPPPPPHIESAPVVVHKGDVEKAKAQPPKPVPQHPQRPAVHQQFVEQALDRLHAARWIDSHPGDPDKINDPDTKRAVREFQTKFAVEPIDGIAGPITRKALQRVLQDLQDGKPPPHHAPPPPKPRIDRVAWLCNRIEPGQASFLAVHGVDLDLVTRLQVTLKDRATKREAKLAWDCVLVNDIGVTPVVFPTAFERGAEVVASFSGSAGGAQVHYQHDVPIYIGKIATPAAGDWPWDEALWTPKMRDIIADLRATPKPTGPFERWEITQYGVKEKLLPGDIEVKSKAGEVFGTVSLNSLMKADIEGTMRLGGKILNITRSGSVYEPQEQIVDGKTVIKYKPNPAKFDPAKSQWTNVTSTAPWGAGARMPLVPFRTLALNPKYNPPSLFYKKVYIKQLDGMTLPNGDVHNGVCIAGDVGGMRPTHFDLCVGREDRHITIPSVGGRGGTICEVQILGESAVSRPGKAK